MKSSQNYAYQNLIGHLSAANERKRMFYLVDHQGFLAQQADHFGNFGRTSEDVESFLLPNASKAKYWNRFFQYAAVALNLRGMAEDLATPEILSALARAGQGKLAADSVSRIPDPLRRAAARAVIAEGQRTPDEFFRQQLEAIERDLEAPLAPPAGDEESRRRAELLADMARRLGVDLDAEWTVWIERVGLSAEQASLVWRGVAEAWLDRGDLTAPSLWEAVGRINESGELLAFLPARLGQLVSRDPEALLNRLAGMFDKDGSRLHATMVFLAQLAVEQPDTAAAVWERWLQIEEVSWTVELIETGRILFAVLEAGLLEDFLAGLSEPMIAVAARVVVLESKPTTDKARVALEAIERLPDGPLKLHWALRYLKACPCELKADVCSQIGHVALYLDKIRFDAPPKDLRLYLELVAEYLKGCLPSQIDEVMWSLGGKPETLLDLAQQAESQEILQYIIDKAELFSVGVATDSLEAFSLRREALIHAATRLCLKRKKLDTLEDLSARLLPDEEIVIFELLASRSPHLEMSRLPLTQYALGRLRSKRQWLLAYLTALPAESLPTRTPPSTIYSSLSRIEVLEDELRGLRALHRIPRSPREIIDSDLLPIRNSTQKLRSLLRFGHCAVEFQDSAFGGVEDRLYPVEAVQKELTVEGGDQLVAWTPDIAELGAKAGGRRIAFEFIEAARRLISCEEIRWIERLQSLELLLVRFLPIFQELCRNRDHHLVAMSLRSLFRLPFELEPENVRLKLRAQWHEVLPVAIAVLDRLTNFRGRTEVEKNALASIDFLPNPFRSQIFGLCRKPPEERELTRDGLLPHQLGAVVLLLSAAHPQRVVELLGQLSPGSTRDQICLRLLRHSWIMGAEAVDLANLVQDQCSRQLAVVWSSSHLPGESWIFSFAELLTYHSFDVAHPTTEPIVRALWKCDPAVSRSILADAISVALESGGRPQGEFALRLWLHSLHPPRSGGSFQDDAVTVNESINALRRATRLELTLQDEPSSSIEKLHNNHRYKRIYSRFRRAQANLLGTIPFRSSRLEARSFYAVFTCLPFCALELILWLPSEAQTREFPPFFDTFVGLLGPLACIFLLTRPISGFIRTLVVARRLPKQVFPPRLKAISFLMGCIPQVGIFLIVLSLPVLRRHWTPSPPLTLRQAKRHPMPSTRGLRFLTSPLPFFWLGVDAALFLFFLLWIATSNAFAPFRRETVLFLCLIFHLLGFAAMTMDIRHSPSNETGWRHAIRPLLPFTFLLPFPAQLMILVAQQNRQSATALHWDQGSTVEGHSYWRRIEDSIRRHWRQVSWNQQWRRPVFLEDKVISGNAEARLHRLCRRKALLLVPEAFAAMLCTALFLINQPELLGQFNQGYLILAALLISLAILGLLAEVMKSVFRTSNAIGLKSYGRYVLVTMFAILWGSQLGLRLVAGEIKQLGALLALLSVLGLLQNTAFPLPFSTRKGALFLGSAVAGTGLLIACVEATTNSRHLVIAFTISAAALTYGFFSGAKNVRWLLRPFRRSHLRAPHLPLRFRAVLWTMVATALLPLGGIAIPFWIWARQRLWPRYEHFAENG